MLSCLASDVKQSLQAVRPEFAGKTLLDKERYRALSGQVGSSLPIADSGPASERPCASPAPGLVSPVDGASDKNWAPTSSRLLTVGGDKKCGLSLASLATGNTECPGEMPIPALAGSRAPGLALHSRSSDGYPFRSSAAPGYTEPCASIRAH